MNRVTPHFFFALGTLLLGASVLCSAPAWSQYPAKTVRIIVAWPAGGPTDTIARVTAQRLSDSLKQSVIVENRPGAMGGIGSEMAARAAPDGYTLLMAVLQDTTRPSLMSKVSFDVKKDLEPIIRLYELPFIITANPKVLGVSTLQELISYAKANPGKLQYASPSIGSAGHLSFELIKQLSKFEAMHVPYKGSAPAIADLLGGQIPVMYGDIVSALPHIRAGRINAIAVSTTKRIPALPAVPTVAESGFPGFLGVAWGGLMVPAGTPQAVKARINAEVAAALSADEIQKKFRDVGVEPAVPGTPDEFGAFMSNEMDKWGTLIKDRGIRLE
jgi:tripartite-type tricarboxylate transporter receptor subunit TctC